MALRKGRPVGESRSILIGSIIPPGTIAPFGGGTVPDGWLLCDGSVVSRTTYAALFAVIGTLHGQGDASTTFHLPDYRGRFLRGADNMGTGAAGRDPNAGTRTAANTGGATGATVGSVQSDAFQGHGHDFYVGNTTNTFGHANTGSQIALADDAGGKNLQSTRSGSKDQINAPVVYGANGTPRAVTETRPLNANTAYIIKV